MTSDPRDNGTAADAIPRRGFLQRSGALGAAVLASAWSRAAAGDTTTWIYAYPHIATVTLGGTLRLHYLTNQPFFRVTLARVDSSSQPFAYTTAWLPVSSTASSVGPENATASVTTDWQWPYADIPVDATWPAGVYVLSLDTALGFDANGNPENIVTCPTGGAGDSARAFAPRAQTFCVFRPSTAASPILYKISLNMLHAYADGPVASLASSFYDLRAAAPGTKQDAQGCQLGDAPDGAGGTHTGYRVTLLRAGAGTGGVYAVGPDPYDGTGESATNISTLAHYDVHLIQWLQQNGFAVDFCTDADIHERSELLGAYRLLICAGHDEYWSAEMRAHVDAFTSAGGNVAFFSGNTCYWRVYGADDDGDGHVDAIVCDKRDSSGSYGAGDGADNWWKQRPENTTTGLSGRIGGWLYAPADDHFGYTIQHAVNWMLTGSGLTDGSEFGSASRLIHYEFDGCDYQLDASGKMVPTGVDGTPLDFVLLGYREIASATTPAPSNLAGGAREAGLQPRTAACMGYFTRYGTVFNGGTTEWPRAVVLDTTVATVTRNVVAGLSAAREIFALADVDGDGKEDAFYSCAFGAGTAVGFWTLNGAAVGVGHYASKAQVAGWAPCAVADFNSDGIKDVVYFNPTTGQMAIWYLGGASRAEVGTEQFVSLQGAPPGSPIAAVDFDLDGRADLLFWDAGRGVASVCFQTGQATFGAPVAVNLAAAFGMQLVGARDFNADGTPDLVFFNASTGQVTIWLMTGVTGTTFGSLAVVDRRADAGMTLVGVGDIDGDGRPELVFANGAGQLVAWFLSGAPLIHFEREVPFAASTGASSACNTPTFGTWAFAGGTQGGDTPTLAVMPSGQVASFTRGSDALVYLNIHSASASWQGWTILSGVSVSPGDRVAVAPYDDGRLVAFVRGSDGTVSFNVQSSADPRQWGGWVAIPGLVANAGDALSATRTSDGRLVVIAHESSSGSPTPSAINWENPPKSGVWTGWVPQPAGGTYPRDAMTILGWTNGLVISFARGADSAIYLNTHAFGSSWQGWVPLPNLVVANGDRVAVAGNAQGQMTLAVRDSSGSVRVADQVPGQATGWSQAIVVPGLALAQGDAIALLYDGSGNLVLGVRAPDGQLHVNARPIGLSAFCGWNTVSGLEALAGDAFSSVLATGRLVFANRRGDDPTTLAPSGIVWQV